MNPAVPLITSGFVASITLALLLFNAGEQHSRTKSTLRETREQLAFVQSALDAETAARAADAQEAREQYETAAERCESTVASAVRAVRRPACVSPIVAQEPETNDPQDCPAVVCECPSIRLRDVVEAYNAGSQASVPSGTDR